MDDPDENLLLRWSRRKHQARQDKVIEPAPPKAVEGGVQDQPAAVSQQTLTAAAPAPAEDTAAVRAEDLPDLETLTYESDFSVFMRAGVPEFIKQQALRKLWLSNPILANLDGLNGYDPMNMTFLDQLEGTTEPIAEVGRSLRDKIMADKRARDDRPRGPHARPGERQARQRNAEPGQPSANGKAEAAAGPADPKSDDV
jgi:Protein of unknown function (DUF3306)